MSLTVLLGGARAGKSDLAVQIARSWNREVTFVATAEAWDDEMSERIRRHQAQRPSEWTTVEEPLHIGRVLADVPPEHGVVIDCLTLWVNNVMVGKVPDEQVPELARELAQKAASHPGEVVVVSNEVGLGVVPMNKLTRRYVDLLGAVNRILVESAARSMFVVAGRLVELPAADPALAPIT